jgi:hypothetical protein
VCEREGEGDKEGGIERDSQRKGRRGKHRRG